MAKRLEDEQERPEAVCPCCGEPLVVEVNVGAIRARLDAPLGGEAPYTLQTYRWDLRDLLAAYDAQADRLAAVEQERIDLEQRVYRLLTHDGTAHGCCWDAMTTAVQSVVKRGTLDAY